ncbi:MAG: DUF6364 family protein [Flavobacteriales bacterium]|jgi:hypothetical protein|nr:DUF6364 family protein [Flavobacteriales bacterium]
MKTKLTLSVDPAIVRKAKALSRRTKMSVSEFFEAAVEKAVRGSGLPVKSWSEEWGGSLNISDADTTGDDRLAKLISRSRKKGVNRVKQRA